MAGNNALGSFLKARRALVRPQDAAYYLQYRNVRPDYVEKLWSLVNWNDVIARFEAARAAA
ncbi:Fe-Mn family superoxide dismutase [Microbispora siamensis]